METQPSTPQTRSASGSWVEHNENSKMPRGKRRRAPLGHSPERKTKRLGSSAFTQITGHTQPIEEVIRHTTLMETYNRRLAASTTTATLATFSPASDDNANTSARVEPEQDETYHHHLDTLDTEQWLTDDENEERRPKSNSAKGTSKDSILKINLSIQLYANTFWLIVINME
jgi:hypothetical protein